MINEDFYILHLSDLHIRNEQGSGTASEFYSFALNRLLSDIEEQTKNRNNIVIVISGDIIDQGNYEKHQPAALKFFADMYKKIGEKVADIIIVPGNHDKCRSKINSLISMSHSREGLDANSETAKLRKQLNDTQKECFEKIQDMEERHEKQMYRAWKQHVDTHYLERFLKEYLSEKLKLDVHETSGDEGWQTINIDLLLDGSRISGGEGSINTRWR